jgi:hypothetical protein
MRKANTDELPRSVSRIGRAMFTTMLEMTVSQPWLKDKQNPLIDLIDECEKDEQQQLVFELLERFTFLDAPDFQQAIQGIADYIQVTLRLGPDDAAISASDNGKYSDSSQLVVYSLKAAQWNIPNWTTNSFVSNLSHLVESAGKGNLVLVDEFVGTGETAEKKVKWLKNELAKSGASPKIYFGVVAGMEVGLSRVRAVADGVFAAHVLNRGISDFYPTGEIQDRLDAMLELERRLGPEGRRGMLKKHSLGYKKSESLYSRASGNTPNNVFPVFWWEVRSDGSSRRPLLNCI